MYGTSYQSLVPPIGQQTSCDQELFSELIDFLIDKWASCVSKLLSEFIQSLVEKHTFCDRELSAELIDSPIDQNLLAIKSSYQSSFAPCSIKNFLRSGALIRARWLPNRSNTSCDQKLLLEFIESMVEQQPSCDLELLSELVDSLINQKLLATRSSYLKHKDSLTDRQTCCDQELLSELIDSQMN